MLRLRIHQVPDVLANERRMKVFHYWADTEDGVCTFRSISDFIFFKVDKTDIVACYGEVWTDEDTNILRMSEHYELPGKSWKLYQGVVTYGWVELAGELRLAPLTIYTQAEHNKKPYWCRGQFTDYRVFSSRVKIIANDHVETLPP